ncbi:FecR family protein [Paraflavitalea sp. CAU 1676]|uniref:FecR family protein n=1 Tax=Paraflavitalea sp. CAU 1676 TaxID=3032598 RepID=UPI0023D9FF12|nr:FecR family protein [Paraflavitalea sp. CAU 1676]MDF2191505.1 FecR family protein [Paraflavitalea sp. CAU 1676]
MEDKEKKINGLLVDHRFIDWVLDPDSIYKEYWLGWMATSEEHQALANEARAFVVELKSATTEGPSFTTAKADGLWSQITASIAEEERNEYAQATGSQPAIIAPLKRGRFRPWVWAAAAVVIVCIGFAGWQLVSKRSPNTTVAGNTEAATPSPQLVRYNGTDRNQLIFLPDGSKVTLGKGAQITYNRLMNGDKRDVVLNGEAFFDVAKNPAKPFYIYTNKMVVKVLGTSFRVISSGNKEAVFVKTGKVSVYLKGQNTEQAASNILLPKQSCTFSTQSKSLHTSSYTSTASIDLATDSRQEYHFEDAPIDSVFSTLEAMYDLPVHYDRKTFEHCFINISLGNEKLEEKLAVITQTINASYTLSDKGITITGEGCK